jgi:FMN-dependent oxidoreductase (nitrilotriacetate monooxygenase family)
MTDSRFHLGWFLNFRPPVWNGPWSGDVGATWADGRFHVEMAQALERAGFDYMLLEDSEMVPDVYSGSFEASLRYGGSAPKHDPVLLVPLLARATSHLGLVATMSTSFYPPYLLARSLLTLDHLTRGRVGWNIVTSSEDRAAQNFGLDKLYPHDERYRRAAEFTDLVLKLWYSWEPDALTADVDSGVYVDYRKVHRVDFEGEYFKSRGPLTVLPSPQRHPVLCQAGSSPTGRDFAARYAETVISVARGTAAMKEFRDDIRARMASYGRDPDSCKIMFVIRPILAETTAEARAKRDELFRPTDRKVTEGLVGMSTITDIDFSRFDLDQPLPRDLTTNGHQSSLESFYTFGGTLREIAVTSVNRRIDDSLVGTPATVAEAMGEIMAEVGGDGFFLSGALTREYILQITDGLVPELRRRRLTRAKYSYATLRENLLEF